MRTQRLVPIDDGDPILGCSVRILTTKEMASASEREQHNQITAIPLIETHSSPQALSVFIEIVKIEHKIIGNR